MQDATKCLLKPVSGSFPIKVCIIKEHKSKKWTRIKILVQKGLTNFACFMQFNGWK